MLQDGRASVWGGWVQLASHLSSLAVIDAGTNLHLWDLEAATDPAMSSGATSAAPKPRLMLRGTGARAWGAWGPNPLQQILITGANGGGALLWSLTANSDGSHVSQQLFQGQESPESGSEVRWGVWGEADGRPVLATGGTDGSVRTWGPFGSADERYPSGHEGGVRWGSWGQVGDRPLLATGDRSDAVRLWDMERGEPFSEPLTGHEGGALWGAWARIGGTAVLAVGAGDGSVRLWDPERGEMLGEPLAGRGGARWGAWAEVEGHPVLATGGGAGTVHLWEVIEDRPAPRVPAYGSDVTNSADALARTGDALAVAELITAPSARPPLAVGLFGDWGEGEGHFLDLLNKQVENTVQAANLRGRHAVRQVRFNAWHYAETDLWASVVSELFTQLAASAENDPGAEQRRQSRLTAEVVAKRGLRARLGAARERHAQLEQALVRPDELWRALSAEQRRSLEGLSPGAEGLYKDAVFSLMTPRGKASALGRLIRAHPLWTAPPWGHFGQ
ncbi:P-loop NTPase fold protein [Streptomyces sp. NPDC058619]|uniref:P-loop NTPase fold protein n=1 Tax=unclassified Streptomyces TaxID=2593676 RepID=UPI00365437B3